MKKIVFALLACALFCSCNSVPNQSIMEPIDYKELGDIIKKDSSFAFFYFWLQGDIEGLSDIDKARFKDVTYRKLYSLFKFSNDTTKINPLKEKWTDEWNEIYGGYGAKGDSAINYWIKYKEEHSLSKNVKIEFVSLDKTYYRYINAIESVNFAFRLTPLQGGVDQIRFNYRCAPKINDVKYAEAHNCIYTKPFDSPIVRYWEADYSDRSRLEHVSTDEFIRDYNIVFEVTEMRKDGVNYSIDDLNIPASVVALLETDSVKNPYLYNIKKETLIKEVVSADYKGCSEFVSEQLSSLLKKKFPNEYEFVERAK